MREHQGILAQIGASSELGEEIMKAATQLVQETDSSSSRRTAERHLKGGGLPIVFYRFTSTKSVARSRGVGNYQD